MKKKEEPYRVVSHTFKGMNSYGDHESYTYEITFNKSLVHTGKFTGIEDGLNNYSKKEIRKSFIESVSDAWFYFKRIFKNPYNGK